MATDEHPDKDHVATFLWHQGLPLSTATTVSDLLDTPEGRAVVARALGLFTLEDEQRARRQGVLQGRADSLEIAEAVQAAGSDPVEALRDLRDLTATAAERTGDEGEH